MNNKTKKTGRKVAAEIGRKTILALKRFQMNKVKL